MYVISKSPKAIRLQTNPDSSLAENLSSGKKLVNYLSSPAPPHPTNPIHHLPPTMVLHWPLRLISHLCLLTSLNLHQLNSPPSSSTCGTASRYAQVRDGAPYSSGPDPERAAPEERRTRMLQRVNIIERLFSADFLFYTLSFQPSVILYFSCRRSRVLCFQQPQSLVYSYLRIYII